MIIKVLICADMAYKRKALSMFISSNPYMVVVNIARNGIDALKMVEKYIPDILILDMKSENLKLLHGFKELNDNMHLPSIFILEPDDDMNSIGERLKELHFREFYYIRKPKGFLNEQFQGISDSLTNKIIRITQTKIQKIEKKKEKLIKSIKSKKDFYYNRNQFRNFLKSEKTIDETVKVLERPGPVDQEITSLSSIKLQTNVIVMGASVGGPKTLRNILKDIPSSFPSPILLVQHLDHFFMRQFAVSLKHDCNLPVKIPRNADFIEPSTIYVSPGGYHMEIITLNKKAAIRVFEGEPVNYCRPSVDVLFLSAAKVYKKNTLGILLTGMGRDGVEGLIAIKKVGGKTIAESEETSVLYGMPKIAKESQAANKIVPNYEIKDYMIQFARRIDE